MRAGGSRRSGRSSSQGDAPSSSARAEVGAPSPAAERLAALDARIAAGKDRLGTLAAERSVEADPREVDRIARIERQGASQIGRLEAEREGMTREAATERAPRTQASEVRLELRLVEERMVQLRRMQVEAERLTPTRPIHDALGPYPMDPRSARAWDDGADLIHAYRLRYGVISPDGDPLGPRSGNAERRHERQMAQQRLERIQRQLEHERVRTAERSFEIEI